jgi:RNA polymerase sigma factor (sigma-70 family)
MAIVSTEPAQQIWASVYQDCFTALIALLQRIIGDRQQALDIAQRSILRIFELRAEQLDLVRDRRAFLFQIACNLARDDIRHRIVRERSVSALQQLAPASETSVEQNLLLAEQIERLRSAIAQLPEQARKVLVMARYQQQSHKEIASALGIAPKTVENHLARALRLLAERLYEKD